MKYINELNSSLNQYHIDLNGTIMKNFNFERYYMHKELNSIKLIRDYLVQKKLLVNEAQNINDIYNFFRELQGKKTFNSLYILNYLYSYIVCDDVAKRKTSARVFEDVLSIIFNGEIMDNTSRKNIQQNVPEYFSNVKDKVAGNKREKIDIFFQVMVMEFQ